MANGLRGWTVGGVVKADRSEEGEERLTVGSPPSRPPAERSTFTTPPSARPRRPSVVPQWENFSWPTAHYP